MILQIVERQSAHSTQTRQCALPRCGTPHGYRRCRPAGLASDDTHSETVRMAHAISSRCANLRWCPDNEGRRRPIARRHASSLSKPTTANRRKRINLNCRPFAGKFFSDQLPEQNMLFSLGFFRSTKGAYLVSSASV